MTSEECMQWVAVTVLVRRDASVLAMQRAHSAEAGAGLWEGVSGRIQPGEDPLEAARREVEEETGLRVQIVERPIASYAARRGDQPMTVIVFLAEHSEGEVILSSEHDDYRWCDAEAFSELGAPAQLVRLVRQYL